MTQNPGAAPLPAARGGGAEPRLGFTWKALPRRALGSQLFLLQLAVFGGLLAAGPLTYWLALRSVSRDMAGSSQLVEHALRRGLVPLAAVAVGGLALLLVGSFLLSRHATRRLQDIIRRVATIDEERLAERIPLGASPEELQPLVAVLNRLLARLEAAFEAQRRFASDVSHEVRSPLTALRGQIEVALRKERSPEEYRRVLAESLEEVERLTRLAEDLLDLARADAGVLELRRERLDLREVASLALRRLASTADARDIQLVLDTREPVPVLGDPDWLGRLLENLVDNAIRHSRRTGEVRIRVHREGERALMRVEDAGEGIPATALPHIFERFYRVDPSRSRDKGGAGLGLAIGRQIVTLHGGTIAVASEPGKGAVFTVTLPIARLQGSP